MADSLVTVQDLQKSYGSTKAVDGLSFSVGKGEIFAMLGPNGAGKTTALECIEGVRQADGGTIEVLGSDPFKDSTALTRKVGIQLQSQGLPDSMTVRDALAFFALYRGSSPNLAVAERLGLSSLLGKQYGTLSTGQQRRLSLALCVQHDPLLVILDEPTAGLDVETRNELHRVISELRDQGTTIILASHDMAEVEKLADRIFVVVQGKPAAMGSPREITAAGNSATRLTISTAKGYVVGKRPQLAHAELLESDGVYARYASRNPGATLKELLGWLDEQDDQILDLRVERPSLEERFLEIVGGTR